MKEAYFDLSQYGHLVSFCKGILMQQHIECGMEMFDFKVESQTIFDIFITKRYNGCQVDGQRKVSL